MITYSREKNQKSKKEYKIVKLQKSIGATRYSLTLSIFDIRLNNLPVSTGIACVLSIGNKVFYKLIKNE